MKEFKTNSVFFRVKFLIQDLLLDQLYASVDYFSFTRITATTLSLNRKYDVFTGFFNFLRSFSEVFLVGRRNDDANGQKANREKQN